jgi:hypothetical protein
VPAAVVALLDSVENRRAATFTDADGRFLIKAPVPATYRLRLERIGYRVSNSTPLVIQAGMAVEQHIEAVAAPLEMPAITAEAKRRCTVRPAEGEAVALLWGEARKALAASEVNGVDDLYRFRIRRYTRQLDLQSLRVKRDSSYERLEYVHGSPFVSAPVGSLLERGFIQTTDTGTFYFAPDAHVLLSDAFADAYCLSPVEDLAHKWVGVSFKPIERTGAPAVAGTLWLERSGFELRQLVYGYTRARLPFERNEMLGGMVDFDKMPTGQWIVRKWRIRLPFAAERALSLGNNTSSRAQVLIGLKEEGGELLEILARTGERLRASAQGSLRGIVYDSIARGPLIGATVYLTGTTYSTETTDRGEYVLSDLPDGDYEIGMSHPKLAVYGTLTVTRSVSVRPGESRTEHLVVSSDAPASRCPIRSATQNPESAILSGWVRQENTGAPSPDAEIALSWSGSPGVGEDSLSVKTVTADSTGAFVACWIPARVPIAARTRYAGQTGPDTAIGEIPSSGFASIELRITSDERGSVPITLQLRDFDNGRAIGSAEVWLSDITRAVSDSKGTVRLLGARVGTHQIKIQHVAYGTFVDTIEVSGTLNRFEIRVPGAGVPLRELEVKARSSVSTARVSRGSRSDILTRKEIETLEKRARHIGDLVRNIPGLKVRDLYGGVGRTTKGVCIESRRGALSLRASKDACNSVLAIVDGIPIHASDSPLLVDWPSEALLGFPPGAIESIEFIPAAEAGARYGAGSANGVLVIYTRGNGPYATPK